MYKSVRCTPNTNSDIENIEVSSTNSTLTSINTNDFNANNKSNNNVKLSSYKSSEKIEEWGELSNKSFYSGLIKNLKPHGKGKEYRSDNKIYDGTFRNGKWHGVGILTDENLDSTECEYVNGRVTGI